MRDGNIDNIDCQKDYLDSSLETFIKQDLKYRPKSEYEGIKTKEGKSIKIDKITRKLDRVIKKYFPEQFKSFKPPSLERMISFYRNASRVIHTYIHGNSLNLKGKEPFVEKAFIAVAAIRHLDDFIDNALWPSISEFDASELSAIFDKFLREALKTVREFDSDMPESVIKGVKMDQFRQEFNF